MIPGHCGLQATGSASMKVPGRQRRLGGRRAKTRRSSRDQSRKRFCNCRPEGRLRTDAEPGLPRERSLVARFPALGTIPWRDQEQMDALGWISLGRDGTGGGLEDGNLLPAGLLSLHHHTWGTK